MQCEISSGKRGKNKNCFFFRKYKMTGKIVFGAFRYELGPY